MSSSLDMYMSCNIKGVAWHAHSLNILTGYARYQKQTSSPLLLPPLYDQVPPLSHRCCFPGIEIKLQGSISLQGRLAASLEQPHRLITTTNL
eukprot:1136988-Pelagomonas_calceolata.AAC.5